MANQNIIKEYSDTVNAFRDQCLNAGMSEEEFKKLYFESLDSIENEVQDSCPRERFKIKYKYILPVVILIIGCCVYNYKTIYSCLICHLQEYIYPGLRLLRKISIPFLSLFPSLTDYYHETCLVQNPFFTVTDMDCWPCSSVNNVREVSNLKDSHNQQQNAPFIYETEQNIIQLDLLQKIYNNNQVVFDNERMKVMVNDKYFITLNEMFTQHRENNVYIWKFNNVQVSKLLRQYIPRPAVVPKFGQSTERYIIIDSSQRSYKIPDTECSYSFLISLSGTRTINLVPAEECKHQCKSLRVELKETYLLWYNWWYWRPQVLPSSNNATFIAHIGSYC